MEYVHGGFTVLDAMIRDLEGNFQLDMSCHHLPLIRIGLFTRMRMLKRMVQKKKKMMRMPRL